MPGGPEVLFGGLGPLPRGLGVQGQLLRVSPGQELEVPLGVLQGVALSCELVVELLEDSAVHGVWFAVGEVLECGDFGRGGLDRVPLVVQVALDAGDDLVLVHWSLSSVEC